MTILIGFSTISSIILTIIVYSDIFDRLFTTGGFMNIVVIGTGYVGLVTGVIFAECGNCVTCVDIDADKIALLKKGKSPIYEPGLREMLTRNIKEKRISFLVDASDAIADAQVIIIGVGTPSNADGSVNLSYVHAAAESIAKALGEVPKKDQSYKVIVNKSTVPIGTGDEVTTIIKKNYMGPFDVVSNPEFLREGQAIADCMNPDRIVVGNASIQAQKVMEQLYAPYDCPKLFTDIKTAEMIKYASNSFLATSISFINSLAELCEAVGADVKEVARGMRLDKRIGAHAFLDAGPGYGGSCFPKDVKGLIDIGYQYGVSLSVLEATEDVNTHAKLRVIEKIAALVGSPEGKKIAIWGLAFKAQTDDVRDAPVLPVLDWLIQEKAKVVAFDPIAQENIATLYPSIQFTNDCYDAVVGADCVIIMTEWNEFKSIDLNKVKKLMNKPVMVDARNIFGTQTMKKLGFIYTNIGNVQ